MDIQTQTYELPDRTRTVVFEGVLLANATTASEGKSRWSEMALYVTSDNKYVVHGVGKSNVAGETDRSWVMVCDTPAGLITALTRRSDGVEYMPHVNQLLLDRAAMIDDNVSDATMRQVI